MTLLEAGRRAEVSLTGSEWLQAPLIGALDTGRFAFYVPFAEGVSSGAAAKTFVSFIRFAIREYSLGSWGTSSMVLHTAVGIPSLLNRLPTV